MINKIQINLLQSWSYCWGLYSSKKVQNCGQTSKHWLNTFSLLPFSLQQADGTAAAVRKGQKMNKTILSYFNNGVNNKNVIMLKWMWCDLWPLTSDLTNLLTPTLPDLLDLATCQLTQSRSFLYHCLILPLLFRLLVDLFFLYWSFFFCLEHGGHKQRTNKPSTATWEVTIRVLTDSVWLGPLVWRPLNSDLIYVPWLRRLSGLHINYTGSPTSWPHPVSGSQPNAENHPTIRLHTSAP